MSSCEVVRDAATATRCATQYRSGRPPRCAQARPAYCRAQGAECSARALTLEAPMPPALRHPQPLVHHASPGGLPEDGQRVGRHRHSCGLRRASSTVSSSGGVVPTVRAGSRRRIRGAGGGRGGGGRGRGGGGRFGSGGGGRGASGGRFGSHGQLRRPQLQLRASAARGLSGPLLPARPPRMRSSGNRRRRCTAPGEQQRHSSSRSSNSTNGKASAKRIARIVDVVTKKG